MCSAPLGSPTPVSKRSYVHVPEVRYTVVVPGTSMSAGGVWYQGGYTGGYNGWVYRVGNTGTPSHRALSPPAGQRLQGAGPTPAGGRVVRKQGGRPLRVSQVQVRPPPTPAGPGRYSPAPGGGLPGGSSSSPRGRHLRSFPVKLVKSAKCHWKVSIRPVIVPILKTALRNHLLKFSDFHIPAPSLPRN